MSSLEEDVADFLAERPGLDVASAESTKGKCHDVSRELAGFLRERGHDALAVEGTNPRDPLPADAHPYWREFVDTKSVTAARFKVDNRKFLYHVVVKVGRRTVDLTGAQFGSGWSAVLWTWADFQARWRRLRVFGVNADGGSGPWRRTRRRR